MIMVFHKFGVLSVVRELLGLRKIGKEGFEKNGK